MGMWQLMLTTLASTIHEHVEEHKMKPFRWLDAIMAVYVTGPGFQAKLPIVGHKSNQSLLVLLIMG